MPTPVRDKYYLKFLHEEIALFDRKLAHLQRFETFPSETEKNAAAAKMSVKRGQLVRTAKELAGAGIEFRAEDLPMSLREGDIEPAEQPVAASDATVPKPAATVRQSAAPAPFPLRTPPEVSDSIREYLKQRKRPGASAGTQQA